MSKYRYDIEFQRQMICFLVNYRKRRYIELMNPYIFDDDIHKYIFRYIKKRLQETHKVPSFPTIQRNCGGQFDVGKEDIPELKEKILERVDEIIAEDINEESKEEIEEMVLDFIKMQEMRKLWVDLSEDIDRGFYEVPKYLGKMQRINSIEDEFKFINYFVDYHKEEFLKEGPKITTGFKKLDDWLEGGLQLGEIGTIVGESEVGKTMFLLNLAVAASISGHDVLYFTFEVTHLNLKKRIDSRLSLMTRGEIGNDREEFSKRIDGKYRQGDIMILWRPAHSASVDVIHDDIRYLKENHVGKNGEKFNPKLILIDYLDLVATPKTSDISSRWFYLGRNAEILRGNAVKENYAIWSAQQAVRKSYGKEPGMEDTQGSIRIPQASDVFLSVSYAKQGDLLKVTAKKCKRGRKGKNDKMILSPEYQYQRLQDKSDLIDDQEDEEGE